MYYLSDWPAFSLPLASKDVLSGFYIGPGKQDTSKSHGKRLLTGLISSECVAQKTPFDNQAYGVAKNGEPKYC